MDTVYDERPAHNGRESGLDIAFSIGICNLEKRWVMTDFSWNCYAEPAYVLTHFHIPDVAIETHLDNSSLVSSSRTVWMDGWVDGCLSQVNKMIYK